MKKAVRTDLFQNRKCIHVTMDKEVHSAFRARLFTHNLSMQQVMEEFVKLLVTDDARANRIVENLVLRKVRDQIDGIRKVRLYEKRVGELDHDALYDLINEKQDDEEKNEPV